jgi:hypothetical protein
LFKENPTCLNDLEMEDIRDDDVVTIDDLKWKVIVEEHGHQQTQHECMLYGEGSTCTFLGIDVMFLDEGLSFDSLE